MSVPPFQQTLLCSFTRDVFKDLINNVQRSTKVDQSNLQLKEKPEYLIEQKLLNEAMEYVMEKTARVGNIQMVVVLLINFGICRIY